MKKIFIILVVIIGNQLLIKAQTNAITVKPYGYISYEIIYDSYKSVDNRDGEMYYYPSKRVLDKGGKDVNSRTYLQMLSLQSRFGINISGPDLGLAKTTAQIEADFYGTADSYVNLVRLRQAWFKLSWEKTDLLFGQANHPTIIADCSPATLSFGSGVPYHTLNRSVQARIIYKLLPNIKLSLAALMAGTHVSSGPREAQRKSGLPEMQGQIQFGSTDKFLIGFTAGYKFLSVLDTTRLGFKTSARTGSYNLQGYTRLSLNKLNFKYQLNYGTNLTNFSFIGGYGVKSGSEDPMTGELDFANLKTLTTWLDIETKFSKINFGLFSGYGQNLGGVSNIDLSTNYYKSLFFNRNADISYIFRVAPRCFMKINNFLYGIEYGLNGAAYGTEFNSKRKATKTDNLVYNNRILLLVKYNF